MTELTTMTDVTNIEDLCNLILAMPAPCLGEVTTLEWITTKTRARSVDFNVESMRTNEEGVKVPDFEFLPWERSARHEILAELDNAPEGYDYEEEYSAFEARWFITGCLCWELLAWCNLARGLYRKYAGSVPDDALDALKEGCNYMINNAFEKALADAEIDVDLTRSPSSIKI